MKHFGLTSKPNESLKGFFGRLADECEDKEAIAFKEIVIFPPDEINSLTNQYDSTVYYENKKGYAINFKLLSAEAQSSSEVLIKLADLAKKWAATNPEKVIYDLTLRFSITDTPKSSGVAYIFYSNK